MRERPEGFSNVLAVQWLCAAVEQFIGNNELADTPGFLSGFSSIADHHSLASFARAAFSLRQLGVSYTSENELRQAVYDFLTWEELRREEDDNYVDQPYSIDPRSRRITFMRRAGNDPRIEQWAQALERGIAIRMHGMSAADPARPMGVDPREAGARRINVALGEAAEHLPERPSHVNSPRERSPVPRASAVRSRSLWMNCRPLRSGSTPLMQPIPTGRPKHGRGVFAMRQGLRRWMC